MKILRYSKEKNLEIINQVTDALLKEELVILPTETVYGIMALSTPVAIGKLYEAKKRRIEKPTAILVGSTEEALKYLGNSIVSRLGRKYWPGPLTLVKEAKIKVGSWPKLGARVPADRLLLDILHKLKQPIMASSANISGQKAAVAIEEVPPLLQPKVAVAVDRGPAAFGQGSTVVEIDGDNVHLIRQGPIAISDIIKTISE